MIYVSIYLMVTWKPKNKSINSSIVPLEYCPLNQLVQHTRQCSTGVIIARLLGLDNSKLLKASRTNEVFEKCIAEMWRGIISRHDKQKPLCGAPGGAVVIASVVSDAIIVEPVFDCYGLVLVDDLL